MNTSIKPDKELDDLFLFAPPKQLRQSITQVFFSFLTNSKTELPNNFEQVAEDIYFLLNFLEQVDKNKENKNKNAQSTKSGEFHP